MRAHEEASVKLEHEHAAHGRTKEAIHQLALNGLMLIKEAVDENWDRDKILDEARKALEQMRDETDPNEQKVEKNPKLSSKK